MRYSAVAVTVAAAATLATPASAGFNPGSSDNVAVYWGKYPALTIMLGTFADET